MPLKLEPREGTTVSTVTQHKETNTLSTNCPKDREIKETISQKKRFPLPPPPIRLQLWRGRREGGERESPLSEKLNWTNRILMKGSSCCRYLAADVTGLTSKRNFCPREEEVDPVARGDVVF